MGKKKREASKTDETTQKNKCFMYLKTSLYGKEIHERKQVKQDKNTKILSSYRVQQTMIRAILAVF